MSAWSWNTLTCYIFLKTELARVVRDCADTKFAEVSDDRTVPTDIGLQYMMKDVIVVQGYLEQI